MYKNIFINHEKVFFNIFTLFIILSSLIMYPYSLELFDPLRTKLLVVITFFIAFIYALKYRYRNTYVFSKDSRYLNLFILWWGLYFISLTVGTFFNHQEIHIYNYLSYLSKMFVFLFCLLYLDKRIILNITKLYSYLALVVVSMSIIIGVLVALNLISYNEEISSSLPTYLKFYYLVFYAQSSPLEFFDFPLYRLQGYSIEAGIFALSLILPALYFLIIEKKNSNFIFIILGMIWSFSFPIFIVFVLFIFLLSFKRSRRNVKLLSISVSVFIMVVIITQQLEKQRIAEKFKLQYNKEMIINDQTFVDLRRVSLKDRTDAFNDYLEYMSSLNTRQVLFGIGAANSTYIYKKTIANGYLFKLIDAGIIGLFFYMLSALTLFIYSIKTVIKVKSIENNEVIIVLALTTIGLLLISTLRQSYDVSYWQMFIYASLFVLGKQSSSKIAFSCDISKRNISSGNVNIQKVQLE